MSPAPPAAWPQTWVVSVGTTGSTTADPGAIVTHTGGSSRGVEEGNGVSSDRPDGAQHRMVSCGWWQWCFTAWQHAIG